MCDTCAVSIPQPAPHPLRTTCLCSPHHTYAVFLTSIIEGREHKELEPEKMSQNTYIAGHHSDTSQTSPNAGNVKVLRRSMGSSK